MVVEPSQATDWIEWAKFAVALVAPFLALGGGVWLFFLKQRSERESILRKERREIYSQYLGAIQKHKDSKSGVTTFKDGLYIGKVCSPFHEKLNLVAPDYVVEASLRFINKHVTLSFENLPEISVGSKLSAEETTLYMSNLEILSNLRAELIQAMRRDLLEGTKIEVKLPRIEDIQK